MIGGNRLWILWLFILFINVSWFGLLCGLSCLMYFMVSFGVMLGFNLILIGLVIIWVNVMCVLLICWVCLLIYMVCVDRLNSCGLLLLLLDNFNMVCL